MKTSSLIIFFILLIFPFASARDNTLAAERLLVASDDSDNKFIIHANTPTEFIGEYLPHKIYFSSIKKESYNVRINVGSEKHLFAYLSESHVIVKFLDSDTNQAIRLGETDSKQLMEFYSDLFETSFFVYEIPIMQKLTIAMDIAMAAKGEIIDIDTAKIYED